MGMEIWVDGCRTDRMPERGAAELLRYARQMVVRHRWDANLYPFWVRVKQAAERRCMAPGAN